MAVAKGTPLGWLLRLPLRFVSPSAIVPILRGPIRGRQWIVGSGNHGYWIGIYEREKQRQFMQVAERARVVFDIGANVGFYTLLAATAVGSEGRVFAFEPAPVNLHYLREHLRLNRFTNVLVLPCAVADISGRTAFDPGPNTSMGALSETGRISVDTATLDSLTNMGKVPDPDLIKIDVEGAEVRVLEGARETIARARPTIFLATHGRELKDRCSIWLVDRGYQLLELASDELIATPRCANSEDTASSRP